MQRGDSMPAHDSVQIPAPVLELRRGQPVRLLVKNTMDEFTGVHWHGLEIESFPDGVPNFSGMGGHIMPPIAPGDSFAAEFTPPRSGTFPYHSHLNELRQIGSGMYGESVFFMGARGASSSASLLFVPERVLSLHDASRETAFEEGRDFEVRQNEPALVRLPGSRMPSTAPEDVSPLICAGNDAFHRRQVEVTYTHAGGWDGPTPLGGGEAVPGTIRRLRAAEPVRVALTGDSISEGYNASGFIRVPPYQAAYGALVAAGLEQTYGSPIELHNFAVAGWTSDHGLADVERVASVNPQLVIVAYGMNDASYAEPAELATNVSALMDQVRRTSPDAEFVIVSPMLQMPSLTKFIDGTGPVWTGNLFPFLFITIACGAVSGFHALISSGTTPKMIAKEWHADGGSNFFPIQT